MATHLLSITIISGIAQFCSGDISCDSGYIRSKTYVWNTTVALCLHPSSEEEIIDIISNAMIRNLNGNSTTVRAVGASISYSAVGMLDEVNFDTKQLQNVIVLNTTTNLNNIIDLNKDDLTMTFQSGLRYIDLLEYLTLNNYSMHYTAGPTFANFVGLTSTGTHGGGTPNKPLPIIAKNIIGLRMVIGNGTVVIINETYNKHLLDAVLVSFGCLGIITEVTVKIKTFVPIIQSETVYYANLSNIDMINDTFYNDIVPIFNDSDIDEILLRYRYPQNVWELTTRQYMQYVSENDINKEELCWENDVYQKRKTNMSTFKCQDIYYKSIEAPTMQYADVGNREIQTAWFVPIDKYKLVIMDVIDYVYQQKQQNTTLWQMTYNYASDENKLFEWYQSFQFVDGDNIWLSPAGYNNNTAVIQIANHLPERIPMNIAKQWQLNIYNLLKENYYPVRVHWAKISMTSYCDLKDSYPKIDEFIELRNIFDPYDIFLNSFTRDKLGLCHNDCCQCCCTAVSCIPSHHNTQHDTIDIFIVVGVIIGAHVLIIVFIWRKSKIKKQKNKQENELSTLFE